MNKEHEQRIWLCKKFNCVSLLATCANLWNINQHLFSETLFGWRLKEKKLHISKVYSPLQSVYCFYFFTYLRHDSTWLSVVSSNLENLFTRKKSFFLFFLKLVCKKYVKEVGWKQSLGLRVERHCLRLGSESQSMNYGQSCTASTFFA